MTMGAIIKAAKASILGKKPKATPGAPAVSRIAPPPTKDRQAISDADAKQIRTRQEAESIPEGDVKRGGAKRKKGSWF